MQHKELGILKNMRKRLSPSFAARIKQNTIQYVTPNWFWVTSGKVVWKGLAAGMAFTISNNACESFLKPLLRSFLGGIGSRRPAELLNIIEKNVFTYHTHAIGTSKGNNWKSPCFQFPKSQFYCDRCWRWFVPDSSLKILLCSEHVQKINVPALISFVQVNVTTFNTLTIWKSKLMHKTSIVEGIVPQIQRGRPLKQHIQSALHKRIIAERLDKPGPVAIVPSQRIRSNVKPHSQNPEGMSILPLDIGYQ